MNAPELRKHAAEYRRRATEAKDHAVKDSLLLLAEVCEEEASVKEWQEITARRDPTSPD